MWRSKKFIVIAVLATILLVGSISGGALAADNGDDSGPAAKFGEFIDRVSAIYEEKTGVAIDQEALKDAFAQAQGEMREAALDNHLQKLVDEGIIDPDEASAYKEWLQARPNLEQFRQQLGEWQQARPDVPPELKEWWESRPDDVPFKFGFGGRGGFRGMGGMRGFGGPCPPTE